MLEPSLQKKKLAGKKLEKKKILQVEQGTEARKLVMVPLGTEVIWDG